MIRFTAVVLLAISGMAVAAPAPSGRSADVAPPVGARSWEMAMSRSALLGFQLAMQRGLHQGKVTPGVVDCVNHIDPAQITPQFRALMDRELKPGEIEVIERFWKSDVGARLAEMGMAQLYRQIGLPPLVEPAALSDIEQAQVNEVISSSAARRLTEASARGPHGLDPDVAARLMALFAACRAKGG
jgi:hypothetical protein